MQLLAGVGGTQDGAFRIFGKPGVWLATRNLRVSPWRAVVGRGLRTECLRFKRELG